MDTDAAVSMSSVNSGTVIRVSTLTSSRSKPVQNALPPAPVMINARNGALRKVAAAQASSPNISTVCEFPRCGRFTDITTIPGLASSNVSVCAVRSSSRTSVSGRRDTRFQGVVAVLMFTAPRSSGRAWP